MLSVRTFSGLVAALVLATSFVCAPADARKRQHHHRAKAPIARTMAPAPRTIAPDARTTSNYDGNWSVLIVTNSGQCDRGYRYGVTIRGGRVSYEGGAAVNVQGAVSGNGAVQVRLSAGSQGATGSGRLGRDSGGGTWRGIGSSGSCSGTWTAERRG
jgi:hypothetical protein